MLPIPVAFPGSTELVRGVVQRMKIAASLLLTVAAALPAAATTLKISAGSATRTASEVEADYSASHLYVDEVAGDSVPVTIFFDPQTTGVQTCEVFTNLNRRDRADDDANGDGVHDGIKLPNGNNIPTGSDAHYYKPHPMSLVSGGYQLTLPAQKCGVYRVTVRWRKTSDAAGTWRWYSDEDSGVYKKRDHAVIVSPVNSRDMRMYELNALNMEAEGTLESQRSTFADLHDAPGATRTPRWNLDYVRGLGLNWLWFQPVHPFGVDGRHLSAADINARDPSANAMTKRWNAGSPFEDVNYPYALGSPYAVKNFFEIEPRLSKANTRAAALAEFQVFVAAADNGGADTMNVMLDAPFNHTSWDFSPGASPADQMRNREARLFSRSGNYGMRAFSAASIAPAPDRGDFNKFLDAYDLYFGRYAALVIQNPADNGNRFNEGEWFDTSVGNEGSFGDGHGHFDAITQNVWRYFAEYCEHWLTQTGCTTGLSDAEKAWRGIDGLRADFAQGVPPQAWEYIVNRTKTRKWNFVFMAESLDGGAVSYRSSRHFDVMNERILFDMKSLNVAANNMTTQFRTLLDDRRTAYGQSMVLLNTTSHDEDNYSNEWEPLIRYAVCATNDGVPMLFSGQELGLNANFGTDLWERNLGKFIPHFKTYNSWMPLWGNSAWGLLRPYQFCAGIGEARRNSPALRSSNHQYLNTTSGSAHQRIFSVAKFEQRNGKPNFSDTVFAFVNLDRGANQSGTFNVNVDTDGNGNDFGILPARSYRFKNIAAYEGVNTARRGNFTGAAITGSTLLGSGLPVTVYKLPAADSEWTSTPFEPQFLKLYDVTPPNAPAAGTVSPPFAIGTSFPVSWTPAVDNEAGISGYRVRVMGHIVPTQQQFLVNAAVTSVTVPSVQALDGSVLVQVWSISPAGIESSVPLQYNLTRLSGTGDQDKDGFTDGDEQTAGTDPFNAASRFVLTSAVTEPGGAVALSFSSLSSRRYTLRSSADLSVWADESEAVNVPGNDGTLTLRDLNPGGPRRFYRIAITMP
jgi:glycosidase